MDVSRIKRLLPLLFLSPALALCGCISRSEGSSSTSSLEGTGGPTILVPEPEVLTPLEIALDLKQEVSAQEMNAIVTRVRREGKYLAQGCGFAAGEDGKSHGAFSDYFSIKFADGENAEYVTIGYLQKGNGLNSVEGKGFRYRLRQGVFYREKLPDK